MDISYIRLVSNTNLTSNLSDKTLRKRFQSIKNQKDAIYNRITKLTNAARNAEIKNNKDKADSFMEITVPLKEIYSLMDNLFDEYVKLIKLQKEEKTPEIKEKIKDVKEEVKYIRNQIRDLKQEIKYHISSHRKHFNKK